MDGIIGIVIFLALYVAWLGREIWLVERCKTFKWDGLREVTE